MKITAALLALGITHPCRAENWPTFRGPTGMGQSVEKDLPLNWGGKENANIVWKAPLPHAASKAKPDNNQSSPIVWDKNVFVTTSFWPAGKSQKEFPEHHVTCFSTEGKQRWDAQVEPGKWLLSDLRGGYTAPTPVTDGERVYALFGSGVLAAFDFDGKPLWRRELPEPQKFDVAIGASPILYQNNVLVLCDKTAKSSHLLALDKRTGELSWDVKRPDIKFDHTTPVIAKLDRGEVLLIGAGGRLEGVDPATGKTIWWVTSDGDVPCPVLGNGLVYCDSGRGGSVGVAVDPTGAGDVTKSHVRWKTAKRIGGLGSPIVSGPYLYRLTDSGLVEWNMSDGELLDDQRLRGAASTPSPFATADGRIYFASAGKSYVIKTGPKIELIGEGDLDEENGSSAAVSNGRIYLKGRNHLFAIGK